MWKKLLKCLSTECKRVHHGDTQGFPLLEEPDDPSTWEIIRWHSIQLKLFGRWWIKVKSYMLWLDYNKYSKNADNY